MREFVRTNDCKLIPLELQSKPRVTTTTVIIIIIIIIIIISNFVFGFCQQKKLKVHQRRFENLQISSSLYESNMLKISHYNSFYFLRYVKSLFTDIQKR